MGTAGQVRKRIAGVAVLALALASLGALVASPAAASYYEQGVSFSGVLMRDSVRYALNIKALETMGFTHRLEVTISKLEDPAGRAKLSQRQTWSFEMEASEFDDEGDDYRIDAGGEEEPFHVKLTVERRQDSKCSEDQQLFVTMPEDGAFRIETGNEVFGTITELPECGSDYWFSSGPPPPPPPCPVEGIQLSSSALQVKRSFSGDVARLAISGGGERDVAGHPVVWSVSVRGTLPANNFRLNRDFVGSLRAGQAPWLEGTANFEPRGRVERGDWFNCKGGREARAFVRSGAITGDLTLDVIGYEDHRFDDPDALAIRSRVRPRT